MNNTKEKIKLLCWSDSPLASTGFGVVSKYVISSLYRTGRYDIHQLAINHHGEFHDTNQIPWQIQPAKLLDPRDPHGMKMFIRTVAKGNYDVVWILNDLYVTQEIVSELRRMLTDLSAAKRKIPKIVYYYPVDCKVLPDVSDLLDIADVPVCYTDHGHAETLAVKPHLSNKLKQVPHGINTHSFYPLNRTETRTWRKKYFGINDDTFLVINVNRNSTRKQIPYTIQAFKEFRKSVPNSMLYLHTMARDQGGDMLRVVQDQGFSANKDVIFPANYTPQHGVSDEILNRLYNCADMYISTHLGEGWGLSVGEALACGVPTLVPDNTCMPQLIGKQEERGYLYACNDEVYIDNSGVRKKGLIPDITSRMVDVYMSGRKEDNPKVQAALKWAEEHDWNVVTPVWHTILTEALSTPSKMQRVVGETV
jgi:glycosyltransferase involved in cell wall biosynthesis